ncbi:YXWGXW repeat-containing protein [Bradyrhizobium sp. S69]|uniref:YXWGXW repeat-containing protein n=1 Tax=Bradyrhizobium sp. S69 TaxID=1641856 RepID=UPI001AED88A9|nr:YXWGXW repeat-containing protein [Bradyrhizobium sp. S69]
MRMIRSSVLALMLSAAPAAILVAPARAQISVDIRVDVAPPPLPYYEQPVIPAEGYLWVPGYWAWDPVAVDYYWVPGTWVEPPQRDLLWTPAYWGWNEGRYAFYPGYWGHEVGFYGGVDYGYGYNGDGYYGGRWNNGAFFYNRTVNNVESIHITNIYNETVVVHNNSTRVSFNGGNGGIAARPTPQQEAFGRERHVEATPVQRQQVETASRDRSLFSKQNHGEPAIAATPRAGVFQGAGVVRGSRTPIAARPGNEPLPNGAARPDSERPGSERPGSERPGVEPNREAPKPEARPGSAEAPRPNEPRPGDINREAPRQAPRVEEPPRAEPSRAEPPRAEPPRAEPPRAEPPRAEPPRVEEPQRQPPPRAEQPRPPVQEARPPQPPRPAAAPPPRPAQPGRPPEEERKRE